MSVDDTFRTNALVNTKGIVTIDGQELPVEMFTSDPTLVSGVPRVWVNLTSGKVKASLDGVAKVSVPLLSDTGTALQVEILSSDPALVAGTKRVWINSTSHKMEFTDDGITIYVVTST